MRGRRAGSSRTSPGSRPGCSSGRWPAAWTAQVLAGYGVDAEEFYTEAMRFWQTRLRSIGFSSRFTRLRGSDMPRSGCISRRPRVPPRARWRRHWRRSPPRRDAASWLPAGRAAGGRSSSTLSRDGAAEGRPRGDPAAPGATGRSGGEARPRDRNAETSRTRGECELSFHLRHSSMQHRTAGKCGPPLYSPDFLPRRCAVRSRVGAEATGPTQTEGRRTSGP